jgi:uncharacterized membrane protein
MIDNPLLMNDWNIRKFLYVVIAVQAAMLGLATLWAVGVDIPFLRYVVGFIYLTFIPGIIILRTLRQHDLDMVRTLLYTVGLSIAFNMFLGFIINFLYPYLGITRPLSIVPIFITWTVVLGILCFICYLRDRGLGVPVPLDLRNLLSPWVLLFALLPLVAILGSQLVNNYNNNIALLLLIALIAIVPVLLIATRLVPEQYYPFIVCMISISVLLHTSLITNYIWGYDIRLEYYMYKVVADRNLWTSVDPLSNYNGVLSVTILPAIYGLVLNIDGTWIFKVIFPLFFSLVPLALFQIFQKQFGGKVAFLAVFYFMAVLTFFTAMLELGKQMIAEVFFALVIVSLLDDKLGSVVKVLLVIVFATCIVVSHYATSYLFMLSVLGLFIVLSVFKKIISAIKIPLLLLIIVLSLSWYIYGSGGISFNSLISWIYTISTGIGDFFNPFSRYSFYIITKDRPPWHDILLYLYLLSQICIVIGFSVMFLNWIRKIDKTLLNEYMGFSAVFMIFMALTALLPQLSGVTDISRSFHLCLFILAPYSVYGSEIMIQFAQRVLMKLKILVVQQPIMLFNHGRTSLVIPFALFLFPFFLLNTGFIYEVLNDPEPGSIALSRDKSALASFSKFDITGGTWILNSRGQERIIYCDPAGRQLFSSYVGPSYFTITDHLGTDSPDSVEVTSKIPSNSYVFLTEHNIKTGRVGLMVTSRGTGWSRGGVFEKVVLSSLAFYRTIQESNRIYDNGGALIYNTRYDYIYP